MNLLIPMSMSAWTDFWYGSGTNRSEVPLLGHGGGVSQFTQFYGIIKNKYQILPHTYVESYEGETVNHILNEKLIMELEKPVELFVMA